MGEEEKRDRIPSLVSDVPKAISAVEGSTTAIQNVGGEAPKAEGRIPPPAVSVSPSHPEKKMPSDDEEILKFLKETEQKIIVVGTGGSGTNTLDRLFEMGTYGVTTIGANTDARHLLKIRANKKILLGKKISGGRGAGSNPLVGEEAAKESLEEIKHVLTGASMVFVTCGLGGGTGTGSAPVIAQAARTAGALTVAVVTLPFASEGRVRMENALQGLDKLRKSVDTLIVIKNDKLLNLVPNLPLNTAFKVCDEVLAGSVKGIAELVTKAGLMNVDFADLRTILNNGGYAAIGLGEASIDAKHDERARIAVETALTSPLLDADISGSSRALINVIGGEDMTLKEAEYVVAETSKRISGSAHIIWGARIEENMKRSSMRILVVLAGVKFPQYKLPTETSGDVEELDLDIIG
ncbi:cell division protein FtsZ [Candidatus Micrarchaeota archaeon]|nr:cell division protein FtsZ [Candidatus Micrarchaeota archaeon]